jgi:hypothetical protein
MSITGIVENDTIKLPPGVHVPDSTSARIILETAAGRTLAERYAGLIGITEALPEDMAENHDHYLHGAPKK